MRYFKVLLFISASAVLACGCVYHYYPNPNPAKAVPDNNEITGITGVRHQVPVVVNVIAANDMTGQNKSIWDGSP
ncbi:MAG: hypothetical protein NT118_05215, partial [Lentisphaerae bacterium]|nr:hypothetical protein [Lentisphaerota bacterium]